MIFNRCTSKLVQNWPFYCATLIQYVYSGLWGYRRLLYINFDFFFTNFTGIVSVKFEKIHIVIFMYHINMFLDIYQILASNHKMAYHIQITHKHFQVFWTNSLKVTLAKNDQNFLPKCITGSYCYFVTLVPLRGFVYIIGVTSYCV